MTLDRASVIPSLPHISARFRIAAVRSTTDAGRGHPSICCSASDIVLALFFQMSDRRLRSVENWLAIEALPVSFDP